MRDHGYNEVSRSEISKPTDGSLERIKNFSFNERINVSIYEPGFLSVYAAWNFGIQKSTTPYVFNFNTDDSLSFYFLSTYENI